MMMEKCKILVVDDEERNLRLMQALLAPLGHAVSVARNGREAVDLAARLDVDLVLLDVMMPVMDGFEAARLLKQGEATSRIPVVMVTALRDVEHRVRSLEVGADDFLSKPVDSSELKARVRSLLKVKAYNDHMRDYRRELEAEVARRTEELRLAYAALKESSLDTIVRLSRAAEFKDDDTGAHVLRMSHYSAAVARALGDDQEQVEALLHAAPSHDVGKIGIPDRILLKPGRLDEDEWKIMRRHCLFGRRILEGADNDVLRLAEIVAFTHHEKWDGSGYPCGLRGEDIPRAGRIVAVADVFDALTSRRPYKEPFSIERSFEILREGRGGHFDPEVVDAFFSVEPEILAIKARYLNEGFSTLHGQDGENKG